MFGNDKLAPSLEITSSDAITFHIPYNEDLFPDGLDISCYRKLYLKNHQETEKILSACRCVASKMVSQNKDTSDSNHHVKSIRWAVISQIFQSILTGIQEPCLYEIDSANRNIFGDDVGFIQRAIDEEITYICDCDLCPKDNENLLRIASDIVEYTMKSSKISINKEVF